MTASIAETTAPAVQVGDFFYSSWGYDQTNIDFYRVVGMTASGKSVRVQKWTSSVVEDNGPQVYVVPGEGPVMERVRKASVSEEDYWAMDYWDRQAATEEVPAPVETKRIRYFGSTATFSVNSYSSAYQWDGKPKYQTGSGWGH